MLFILKYLWCVLILGRKPKPAHEHSFGKWFVIKDNIENKVVSGIVCHVGAVEIKRVCSICGEEQVKQFFTGNYRDREDVKLSISRQLSPYGLGVR